MRFLLPLLLCVTALLSSCVNLHDAEWKQIEADMKQIIVDGKINMALYQNGMITRQEMLDHDRELNARLDRLEKRGDAYFAKINAE